MADQPHVEVGSAPVSLSAGLVDGTTYICQIQNSGPIRVYNAAAAPVDLDSIYGRVYDNFFHITPAAGESVWAWQTESTRADPAIISRSEVA